MLEELYKLAIEEGGVWCALCVYLIIMQNIKYSKLENWVRETVVESLAKNTAVLERVEEKLDADKHK